MEKWPDWAWVSRHAENSKNDTLVMTGPGGGHIFPQMERPSYCCRTWGPQEYIKWRVEILAQEAKDLQDLIRLFEVPEARYSESPLIEMLRETKLIDTSP